MDKAELLREFTDKVSQYDKFLSFITKAKEQTGKFATAVVTKVIKDNEEKCEQLTREIQPLTADIERVVGELKTARDQALEASKESQFRLEELELRLAIGDLSEEDFNAEAADYKSLVETTDAKVAELDNERTRFQEILVQWQRVGGQASTSSSPPRAATPEPASRRSAPPPRAETPAAPPAREASPQEDLEIEEELEQTPAPAEGRATPPEPEPMIEEDMGDPFAINSNFDQEIDVPVVPEPDAPEFQEEPEEREERPRRAVLLYQEGTAEEQIYPFTGEVLSLGRGRDNDVQVKNDSKVSRYHCKLFRRGPNFYIEDNKSANGTLVNGELITERRLFGGEEVIIGETFFRFRILD
jgi:hypothetical protein